MTEPTIHYANPDETTFTGAYFDFRFGAYGETVVRVIQRPDHIDCALETAAEWLKEHEPGHFHEPDYKAAAIELGYPEDDPGSNCEDGKVAAKAESDMTHTESGWLLSWEWTVEEHAGEPPELTGAHFDRFDIVDAYFCYWNAYHCGQFSDGYKALCRAMAIGKNLPDKFSSLSDNGMAIYRQLVLRDGR